MQCILFGFAVSFYAVVRPYKRTFSNNVDILILVLLETMSVEMLLAAFHIAPPERFIYYVLSIILLLLVPHMILIFYVCYVLANKAGITQCLKRKYETLKRCVQATRPTSEAEADVEAESDTGSLPDRLINPEKYEPVLPTTEEHTAAELTEDKESDNEKLRRLIPAYTYGSIN